MAAGRSTEKPVSRRNVKDERKLKRKQVEKEDERMEVLHEKKSKMKQDQMVVEPGSKSKAISSSEDDSSSKELDEKAAMVVLPSSSPSNNPKGLISEDVAETSNKQSLEIQPVKEPRGYLFKKMFSYEDEEKILQVMIREGEDRGSKGFWKLHMSSMPLSITVNEGQLYEKGRRLQESYIKRVNNNRAFRNDQDRKVFELCGKLWGKGEEDHLKDEQKEKKLPVVIDHQKNEAAEHSHVKAKGKKRASEAVKAKGKKRASEAVKAKGKKRASEVEKMTMDKEYQQNYDKFVIEFVKGDVAFFPFNQAMKVVPMSRRSSFEKKWEELYQKKIMVVNEILEAIGPSSS